MQGRIDSLYHYPVKGLSPQPLTSVALNPGEGFPFDRNFGFALVHPDCTNVQLQVSHEIGHLLGGDHELNNARSDRSDSDARAHILEGLNRKTIMYVNSSFPEPYFSNPDVCWDLDHPMGVAEVANNARAMSARASVVSKFCR